MLNEKFEALMKDQKFVGELVNKGTIEEAKKLFLDNGVEITEEELTVVGKLMAKVIKNAQLAMKEDKSVEQQVQLTENELDAIVGGGRKITLFAKTAAKGFAKAIVGAAGGYVVGGYGSRCLGVNDTDSFPYAMAGAGVGFGAGWIHEFMQKV